LPVIRSIDDLRRLPHDRRVNGFGPRSTLALRLRGLAVQDQLRLERTLNRYQSRCGCVAGAACFIAAVATGGVYLAMANDTFSFFGLLGDATTILLAAFLLGLIGKLAALGVTRLQFAAACRRFARELSELQASTRALGQAGG